MRPFDALSTGLLLPLLVSQGAYVRRTTPVLVEPDGARQGVIGDGPELRLLVLGDSAAAGVGVASQDQGLSTRLATALSANYSVSWRLLAQSGNTAAGLRDDLASASLESYQIAIISIGVNDVLARASEREWLRDLGEIASLLQQRFSVQTIIFSSIPPMHKFPALPQPLRWWLGRRAIRLNTAMKDFATATDHCYYFSMELPFHNDYMAVDGFHPSALAYSQWGGALSEFLQAELSNLGGAS